MGIQCDVFVNTARQAMMYRGFLIENSIHGWDWTHPGYGDPRSDHKEVGGSCQTVFEALEAVEAWWDEANG